MVQLKNHPVWREVSQAVNSIDAHSLAMEHLEICDYKIVGYWADRDSPGETLCASAQAPPTRLFYEEIILSRSVVPELASSAILVSRRGDRRIQLKFALKAKGLAAEAKQDTATIGKLMLIYDENLEFIDENWQLDLNSPLISAKP